MTEKLFPKEDKENSNGYYFNLTWFSFVDEKELIDKHSVNYVIYLLLCESKLEKTNWTFERFIFSIEYELFLNRRTNG